MAVKLNPFTGQLELIPEPAPQPQHETVILLLTPQETNLVLDANIPAILSFPYTLNISSVRADLDVAPTGSAVIVNMLKNGVTMLNASKFTIAATTTGVVGTLATGVTSISAGDKLTFSIDQVGATVPGQYLTVTINGERA